MTNGVSRYRLADKLITRDSSVEAEFGISELRVYAYMASDSELTIVGEVFATPKPKKRFYVQITIYDKDGDVLESDDNSGYGSGLVTSYIYPSAFFNGFPFTKTFYGVKKSDIGEIRIVPEG